MASKLAARATAIFAALFLLAGCGGPAAPPAVDSPADVLHFNADGTFKVMSISDIQDGANVSPQTITLMTLALDAEMPDLVVLDGDNIFDWAPSLLFSGANVKQSIAEFLKPITDRGIPFAVVFGNHDATMPMSEAAQWDYYQTFPGAVGAANPIDGRTGNYNVTVQNSTGQTVLNLWFMHSGGMTLSNRAAILPDQLAWYRHTSDALKSANGGVVVPSIWFQHIPVPEVYDLLTPVEKGTPGAVKGKGAYSGRYYVANPDVVVDGVLGEAPRPLLNGVDEFDAWLSQGDVIGAVFGHNHNNTIHGKVQGIDLMYDGGVTFYSYGNGDLHGVRVIEFGQADVRQYQTRMVYWKDLTDQAIPVAAQFDGTFAHGAQNLYIAIGVVIVAGLVSLVIAIPARIVRRRRARRTAPDSAVILT